MKRVRQGKLGYKKWECKLKPTSDYNALALRLKSLKTQMFSNKYEHDASEIVHLRDSLCIDIGKAADLKTFKWHDK